MRNDNNYCNDDVLSYLADDNNFSGIDVEDVYLSETNEESATCFINALGFGY